MSQKSFHVPFDPKKLEGWRKWDEAAKVDNSTLNILLFIISFFSSTNFHLLILKWDDNSKLIPQLMELWCIQNKMSLPTRFPRCRALEGLLVKPVC